MEGDSSAPPAMANGSSTATWESSLRLESLALYADQGLRQGTDVAPPLHVSTTYHYPSNPDDLVPVWKSKPSYPPGSHVYSRYSNPNLSRLESLLTALLGAPALGYSSGLSASHAIYAVLRPKRVFITGGYHGVHGALAMLHRVAGREAYISRPLDAAEAEAGPDDVVHVETPINPTGEAVDLARWAALARARGAVCVVDATFAPPPLQDPFALGADIVMHSGTKYIGGHSDILLGVVATRNQEWFAQMLADRLVLGCVPGNMETWLAARSVRSLQVRVRQQSLTATELVDRLWSAATAETGTGDAKSEAAALAQVVESVLHSSVQFRRPGSKAGADSEEGAWLRKQMPTGMHGPVFALRCTTEEFARRLPSKLKLFAHATSLGGVESLIEWRTMSDPSVDPRLMRLSIGLENIEDLYADLAQAALALVAEHNSVGNKSAATGEVA